MNRLLLLAFGAVLGFGLAAAASHFAYGAIGSGTASQLGRFGLAFERVRDNYVDKQEDNTLIGGAIDGMLTNLDAHSSYFDPKTFDAMETKAAGAYGGVGLVITVIDGIAKVVQPIDNTPASRAGVKKDDILVAIDGTPMRGHALDDVSNRMRGTIGTEVTLTVQRGNARMDFKLTRQAIEVERLTYRREGDVGYVKIVAFSDRTDPDLRMAVAVLKKQIGPSLKGFVIDLRNNGGGVLQAAIDVSDDFLNAGEIVSVRGRNPGAVERYDAHYGDIADGKPVVLLVNGGTASASEIVAGALQDHRRATVLGTLTFGKGSVQSIMPLDNGAGGALHMTTARYYTPAGRSIQVTGIVPDIVVAGGPGAPEYQREVELPHHLLAEGPPARPPGKPIEPPAGKSYDDFQLAMALAFLHKTLAANEAPGHI
ncbi:MAG: S41 family peptidase [Alphaproteobacteria bacterium]|nr:S41 family peptidase [Alphaproteobacteria bacterium]MBL7098300.1 S41 family peptidase [Alphaproteobacteria bacterium]